MSEKVITVDMTLQLTFFRLKVSFISYSANFYLKFHAELDLLAFLLINISQ